MLVALLLTGDEERDYALEALGPVEDLHPELLREFIPRRIERDARIGPELLQFRTFPLIPRRGPWIDHVLFERPFWHRDDQLGIVVERRTEASTQGARPVRIIEGKELRCGLQEHHVGVIRTPEVFREEEPVGERVVTCSEDHSLPLSFEKARPE